MKIVIVHEPASEYESEIGRLLGDFKTIYRDAPVTRVGDFPSLRRALSSSEEHTFVVLIGAGSEDLLLELAYTATASSATVLFLYTVTNPKHRAEYIEALHVDRGTAPAAVTARLQRLAKHYAMNSRTAA